MSMIKRRIEDIAEMLDVDFEDVMDGTRKAMLACRRQTNVFYSLLSEYGNPTCVMADMGDVFDGRNAQWWDGEKRAAFLLWFADRMDED